MEYVWDKEKGNKQKEYLESLYEDLKSIEEAKKVREAIYNLEIVLDKHRKKKEEEVSLLETMQLYECYKPFSEIVKTSYQSISPASEEITYSKIPKSDDEILALTDSFYKKLDEEWYHLFTKIFKERKHNIRFNPEEESYSFIPFINYFYLTLRKTDTIEEGIEANHMYAHAISTLINPENNKMFYKSILEEVPSIFVSLLTCKQYKGFSDNKGEYDLYQKQMLDSVASYMHAVDTNYNMYNESSSLLTFPGNLSNHEKVSLSVKDEFSYGLSYLVAIELLYIYYDDPTSAIKILKQIISLEDSSDLKAKLANLNINPGTHLPKYQASLEKKLKK
jgi:hypothetical protein